MTDLAGVFGFLQPAAAAVYYHFLAVVCQIVEGSFLEESFLEESFLGGSFLVGSFLAGSFLVAVAGKVGSDLGVGIPK
jgi:hypothetical protein